MARTGTFQFEPHPYTVFQRPSHGPVVLRRPEGSGWQAGGALRVLCLGGSTTEGGNAGGIDGAYPTFLAKFLEERLDRSVEVTNGGVSGWTTAESMAAYFASYQDRDADIVLIHHAANDIAPMTTPGFRTDYAHWRTPMKRSRFGFVEGWLVRTSRLYTHLTGQTERWTIDALTTCEWERPVVLPTRCLRWRRRRSCATWCRLESTQPSAEPSSRSSRCRFHRALRPELGSTPGGQQRAHAASREGARVAPDRPGDSIPSGRCSTSPRRVLGSRSSRTRGERGEGALDRGLVGRGGRPSRVTVSVRD